MTKSYRMEDATAGAKRLRHEFKMADRTARGEAFDGTVSEKEAEVRSWNHLEGKNRPVNDAFWRVFCHAQDQFGDSSVTLRQLNKVLSATVAEAKSAPLDEKDTFTSAGWRRLSPQAKAVIRAGAASNRK
jgi:hypothetical protein